MSFRFPLIRFSTKERLEELQNGTMYLRNATRYREMEDNDGNTVKGDKFEAKIPYYSGEGLNRIMGEDSSNLKELRSHLSLMRANTFICCMYALKGSNLVAIDENWAAFRINDKNEKIKSLGEYALVICDVDRFLLAFESAEIDACKFRLQNYVEYRDLHDQTVADSISERFISYLIDTNPYKTANDLTPFELIKDVKYEYQQEYRFVVHTGWTPEDVFNEYRGIVKNDGIKIKIEDCKSYSFICKTEDILKRTLYCKLEGGKLTVGFGTFKEPGK